MAILAELIVAAGDAVGLRPAMAMLAAGAFAASLFAAFPGLARLGTGEAEGGDSGGNRSAQRDAAADGRSERADQSIESQRIHEMTPKWT
ncbi:MAG TPA: hypothetical protein VFI22_18405 [Thermomicrobiales bacterium]|nr:hypothetical protein [Thermomicrobiales bacterium]